MSHLACASRRSAPDGAGDLCAHPRVHTIGQRVHRGICELCSFRSDGPTATFRAVPDAPNRILQRAGMELVVARYREDVSWLDRFPGIPRVVYQKGDASAEYSLPNVGREAHTYLHHIMARYDSLADLTVFIQGHPFDHIPDPERRIWNLHKGTVYEDLCHHILVEDREGRPVQPGLPLGRVYAEIFGTPGPDHFLCRAAACFAVQREAIRQYPKAFYQSLLDLVVREELGPWVLERLWESLFRTQSVTEGVATGADASLFQDLQFLIRSLESVETRPIAVFDLGLHPEQRDWLLQRSTVLLLDPPTLYRPMKRIRQWHAWQRWLKPLLIYHAPFDRCLWIDADCVVLDRLDEAFDVIREHPLITPDATPADVHNRPGLYTELPVPAASAGARLRVNSGVVGLCCIRDRPLLNAWAYGIQQACLSDSLSNLVAWADQGMLLWALQYLNQTDLVQPDSVWNQAAREERDLLARAVSDGQGIMGEMRRRYPGARIVHWLGVFKLARQLNQQLELLFC